MLNKPLNFVLPKAFTILIMQKLKINSVANLIPPTTRRDKIKHDFNFFFLA